MKWIIDAQLPKRLTMFLRENGEDATHTLELPLLNTTPDEDIRALSLKDHQIVISKDADFLESYILRGSPYKLLIIATGNIKNDELLLLFANNFAKMSILFESHNVIELNRNAVIIRH